MGAPSFGRTSPQGWESTQTASAATATALALEESLNETLDDTESHKTSRLCDSATSLPGSTTPITSLRPAVLQALIAHGHQSLAETLAEGEWTIDDRELRVQTTLAASSIAVIVTPEVKRQIALALAKLSPVGTLKFNIVPGLAAPVVNADAPILTGTAKSRAAEDPLVQYFQQTFNAEIRTVLDQQKKTGARD